MDENRQTQPGTVEGQDEAFARAARTLHTLTELSEETLLRVVTAGLKHLSPEGLARVEDEARAERLTRQQEEMQRARETLSELARRTGRGVADLFPDLVAARGQKKREAGSLPVKFRGPKGEEWSGRGHKPGWLKDEEKLGRTKEDFAVGKDTQQSPAPL